MTALSKLQAMTPGPRHCLLTDVAGDPTTTRISSNHVNNVSGKPPTNLSFPFEQNDPKYEFFPQELEDSVITSGRPMDDGNSEAKAEGEVYHGRFYGLYYWLQRIHGQWRCDRERWKSWSDPLELMSWKPGEDKLVQNEKQGAVLRLPLVKLRKQGAVLRLPSEMLRQFAGESLEMDTYMWRPPWLEEVKEQTSMDRHMEIERVKRKPPWQVAAAA